MNTTVSIPRPEYPNPQFARENWINLNGEWEFERDRSDSGEARGRHMAERLSETITVPFCMESELSGVGDTDFCNAVWYRKAVTLPEDFSGEGKRVFLHIGACDYRTTVYVNGERVGVHTGGYISFSFEITAYLREGENAITIRAQDDVRGRKQPAGKQSGRYGSYGCYYTRTTGIWQTVWLESTPAAYIKSFRVFPNPAEERLGIEAAFVSDSPETFTATAFYHGKKVGSAKAEITSASAVLELDLSELHLWELGNGELYDLTLTFGDDVVQSYFGMRTVESRNGYLYLNGKPVFQRLVLDQGFYPDGIYTAPDDSELLADIQRSMMMGFNGARLHQKIFEPRFLYHCDRLGYMVWEEHGNWGMDISNADAWKFFPEWSEAVERDFNHPAIIGWCPFNETQINQDPDYLRFGYELTKRLDPTRPVIETSGWSHVAGVGDMMDWHDYDQNPETFRQRYMDVANGGTIVSKKHLTFEIRPTFISEYGGIRWDIDNTAENSWGYGNTPQSEEEFLERFKGLAEALLQNPFIGGLCYTQLTDVEQEINGLYTYGRKPKFDPAFFYGVLTQPAAFEQTAEQTGKDPR